MTESNEPVQVFLKIKPGIHQDPQIIQYLDDNTVSIDNKLFRVDFIARENISAQEFFEAAIKPACETYLSGRGVLVMTYGQTGSGKSFILFGDSKDVGVVQRTCQYLGNSPAASGAKCSFIEVFQDNLYDLLAPTVKGLMIEEDLRAKANVDKPYEESLAEACEVIKKANKRVGGGRSHRIFCINFAGENSQKFVFVDLAGNERMKGSGFSSEKLKESSVVNKSISILGNVIKAIGQKSAYVNFRDSKLTLFLKDYLLNSKILLISTVIPSKKNFWEGLNTLKFGQKLRKIKENEGNDRNIDTVMYLQEKINALKEELEGIEAGYNELMEIHKGCEKKSHESAEKLKLLEEENKILRKEVTELNKIDNSDWLLSSDSEDHESLQSLMKEKSQLEMALTTAKEKLKDKDTEITKLSEKLQKSAKDLESKDQQVHAFITEIEDIKKKSSTYQELSVILSRQNSDLITELSKSKELCYEYIAEFSSMSSTDSSKCEVYKIIEEKDAKASNLLENTKIAEENLQRLREKYFTDTSNYKKQIARLKHELSVSKSENIKENQKAMSVLEDLKQEKLKLLGIINGIGEQFDKNKVNELKEVNAMLIEKLRIKGQQVAELQTKFQAILENEGYSTEVVAKLNRKTQKLKNLRNEFFKIRAHLLKYPQFRCRIDKISLSDFIIELLTVWSPKKNKSGSIDDNDRLNFSHS